MKNALNYYYGLDVLNIHQKNNTYYFKYDNHEYLFMQCDLPNTDKLYELTNRLNQIGVPCHRIVLNNNNQVITKVNDINYILMEVYTSKQKATINDIINFNNKLKGQISGSLISSGKNCLRN